MSPGCDRAVPQTAYDAFFLARRPEIVGKMRLERAERETGREMDREIVKPGSRWIDQGVAL